MSFEENNGSVINLNCDIDDVLIRSSDYIQSYVDSNTIFKSAVLKAIEQLKRNCQYYVNCVVMECERARKEGRMPLLSSFPNMPIISNEGGKIDLTQLSDTDKEEIYIRPVQSANYYLEVANKILEQFLELRDTFLELDNLPAGETKSYDFEREQIEMAKFKEMVRNNYAALTSINMFCLEEAKRISTDAQKKGIIPQYGALVKMDVNDIIRTNDQREDYNYLLFEKPVADILSCMEPSVLDYVLEQFDIQRIFFDRRIVEYDNIYTIDHVECDAVIAIRRLMQSGKIKTLRFVTHHNGPREARAKERMVKQLFPNSEFIGMRFHNEEHHLKRRGRSSKFDGTKVQIIGFNRENELLFDDSKDNCTDWHEKGGLTILFRRLTSAEKAAGMEKFDFIRVTGFEQLESAVDTIISARKQKVKRLEGK